MKKCLNCNHEFNSESWQFLQCGYEPIVINNFLSFAPALAQKNEGFNPESFAILAQLESKNFWFRNRNRLIIWAFNKYFKQAKNFLEIGCGTGFVLSAIEKNFPQLQVYGSEIYSNGLTFASQRLKNAQLLQMDARKIPFMQEFDVIGAFDVIEHIKEDKNVLKQINDALSMRRVILTVPQHRWLWSPADE